MRFLFDSCFQIVLTRLSARTIASVNNVDVLYAAFPILLYLNPDIGGYLLAPLLEFQDSSAYKLPYAARNLGASVLQLHNTFMCILI